MSDRVYPTRGETGNDGLPGPSHDNVHPNKRGGVVVEECGPYPGVGGVECDHHLKNWDPAVKEERE